MTPATGPQAELDAVLAVCRERGVDAYATFCAVLTPYAESDFVPRKAANDETYGCYQQNPRWWPTALGTTAEQCGAFLDAFARIKRIGSGSLPPERQATAVVADCWQVQDWTVSGQPTPLTDQAAWALLPNTANYLRRAATVAAIIKTGRMQ